MSFFGNNIKKIRTLKKLSQQAFADLFDLKRGTLGAYEEGRSEPKIDTIIKIANYFSIPIDDLLTQELTVNKLLKFRSDLTLDDEQYKKEAFASVPCITENNRADYLKYYDKTSFIKDMPVLSLPLNVEKTFRAFTINNLEMTVNDDGLLPNDIVIGELVPEKVYRKLNNGQLIFAVLQDNIIARKLLITGKTAVLRAEHKGIKDIEVDLSEIKELWRVRYVFYRRIPEVQNGLENKLALIEAEINKLKGKL